MNNKPGTDSENYTPEIIQNTKIQLEGKNIHNSREANEAFREAWDQTNARWRAGELGLKQKTS
jgi:hypothetical protein